MNAAEAAILDAAIAAVGDHARPNSDGTLREIKTRDISGREVTEFGGSPLSWMSHFMARPRAVKRFINPATGATLRPGARRSI